MKCLISIIAVSLMCSFIYATDESTLPGATIIELDQIDPGNETKSTEPEVVQPLQPTVEKTVETVETVETENLCTTVPTQKNSDKTAVYTVQLGAFKARERAFALYWQLSKKVTPLQVTAPMPKDNLYRVRYGSYPNREEAQAAAKKLRKKGIECFVTKLKTLEIVPIKKEN